VCPRRCASELDKPVAVTFLLEYTVDLSSLSVPFDYP
jgi:hypothetical protein